MTTVQQKKILSKLFTPVGDGVNVINKETGRKIRIGGRTFAASVKNAGDLPHGLAAQIHNRPALRPVLAAQRPSAIKRVKDQQDRQTAQANRARADSNYGRSTIVQRPYFRRASPVRTYFRRASPVRTYIYRRRTPSPIRHYVIRRSPRVVRHVIHYKSKSASKSKSRSVTPKKRKSKKAKKAKKTKKSKE